MGRLIKAELQKKKKRIQAYYRRVQNVESLRDFLEISMSKHQIILNISNIENIFFSLKIY
jgi:uncharacterized protein YeeX (DUF496 family)